jgi:hypothetical protein
VLVVLVVVVVPIVLSVVLYSEVTGPSSPGSTPIGSAFAAGNPVASSCTSAMVSGNVCATVGDFVYTLSVEQSSIELDDVQFEVHTPTGAIFTNTGVGEFALVTFSGAVGAFSTVSSGTGLGMSGTWTVYSDGLESTSPLTNVFTIVIDMGQVAPTTGMGLTFVAIGVGAYSGTTAPFALP